MIWTVAEIKNMIPETVTMSDDTVRLMQDSIEIMIRKYTNNNFQNRFVRFVGGSYGTQFNGIVPEELKVGDTIQVTESEVNDGLYTITALDEGSVTVGQTLFSRDHNLVTKVEYPADIRFGVINLMKWEIGNRDKVGIKSETLSRHSVTYYDQDANNTVMGYPVSLLGFLSRYKKARF